MTSLSHAEIVCTPCCNLHIRTHFQPVFKNFQKIPSFLARLSVFFDILEAEKVRLENLVPAP